MAAKTISELFGCAHAVFRYNEKHDIDKVSDPFRRATAAPVLILSNVLQPFSYVPVVLWHDVLFTRIDAVEGRTEW